MLLGMPVTASELDSSAQESTVQTRYILVVLIYDLIYHSLASMSHFALESKIDDRR